jgi:hypothetical protein
MFVSESPERIVPEIPKGPEEIKDPGGGFEKETRGAAPEGGVARDEDAWNPCSSAHALTPNSQFRYWGSSEGFDGGGPRGSVRSIYWRMVWISPSGEYVPPKIGFAAGRTSGFGKDSSGYEESASFINAFQIGSAARILDPWRFMGVLSLFPAHTPATSEGVYPTVHASR